MAPLVAAGAAIYGALGATGTAIVAGSAIAGGAGMVASNQMSIKQKQAQNDQIAAQQGFQKTEHGYQIEAEQRAVQRAEEERARQEALSERQFVAQTEDYEDFQSALSNNISYYRELADNPAAMHPDFATYKDQITKQTRASRDEMSDRLTRQGRTGGIQDKLTLEATQSVEAQLGQALTQISKEAREKANNLEMQGSQVPKPYLGQPAENQVQMPYQAFNMQPTQMPGYQAPDFSGFGEALAYSMNDNGTPSPAQQPGIGGTGSTEGLSMDTFLPEVDYLYGATSAST